MSKPLKAEIVDVLKRLLASHVDYTESQSKGWPERDEGYPDLAWSLEIERAAKEVLSRLA